jgi:hypothetical protein
MFFCIFNFPCSDSKVFVRILNTDSERNFLFGSGSLISFERINSWIVCECLYVIGTKIYLHVQITCKIFVRISNIKFLCSESEHRIFRCRFNNVWNLSMFGILISISKRGGVKWGHMGRSTFNCGLSAPGQQWLCQVGLASEKNKARYASKTNLIAVNAHPRIDTGEKWACSLTTSCSLQSKSIGEQAPIIQW